ncbi:hypothetical protein FP2506_03284 [Fulvimarina pelagi HTCC2506]|uniref:Proteophosphoglycan n=2 Tax=Fulvimarina pelagi TaxID=217511 RepID=Q0G076_9HYPH|nr:hypothetical protein FP2506_03284 [Fulvimarina pelagi HTCC2506]
MMNDTNRTDSAGLAALAARAEGASATGAPVERWNPPYCGKIDMRIARDGRWFYQGSPIERPSLVRLFASVLKVEGDGETYLVTPVEKLIITVEDAHFIAVEVARHLEGEEPALTFRTNIGDLVTAGPDHAIELPDVLDDAFTPYLLVRAGLRAKLSRPVAMEVAEWLEKDADGIFLRSGGVRFAGPKGGLADE